MWQIGIFGRESWHQQWYSQDSNGAELTLATIKHNLKRFRKNKEWLMLGVWTNPVLA